MLRVGAAVQLIGTRGPVVDLLERVSSHKTGSP